MPLKSKNNEQDIHSAKILNYFDYNSEDTCYIGKFDYPKRQEIIKDEKTIVSPVSLYTSSLVSFFKYVPYKVNVIKTANGEKDMYTYIPSTSAQKVLSRVPYFAIESGSGVLKHLSQFKLDNYFNPYVAAGYGQKAYEDIARSLQLPVPILTETEYKSINNTNFFDTFNFNPSMTNQYITKEYIRSDSDYKKGEIVEYILMTFGKKTINLPDGEQKVISARDNVEFVPVFCDPDWVAMYGGDEKDTEDNLNRRLYIPPAFIEWKNKQLNINNTYETSIDTNNENVFNILKDLEPNAQEIVSNPNLLKKILAEYLKNKEVDTETVSNES